MYIVYATALCTYLNTHIHIDICTRLCTYVYVHISMYIRLCTYFNACTYMQEWYLYTYVYVSMPIYRMFNHRSMYRCLCMSLQAHLHTYDCEHKSMYVCQCTYVYECLSMCILSFYYAIIRTERIISWYFTSKD